MTLVYLYAFFGVFLVSLISLVGVFTLSISESRVRMVILELISLSVGALFGDVLLHMFPELFASGGSIIRSMFLVFVGIVIFFILEKALRWHHTTEEDLEAEHAGHAHTPKHLAYINLISDGFHNLLDGVIIGVSFLVSVPVGIATTLAVMLHEIPQEIGDFGILLHAGFSRRKALGLNFLSAIAAIIGTAVALLVGARAELFTAAVLPIATGGFLYIAGSDLVPELHKVSSWKRSLAQLVAMLCGFLAMAALLLLE